jgi:Flp pilus assembly pilin Flp
MSNTTQIQTRSTFIARIKNAFGVVGRDRRGNVWVEYLILVAMLGLAGIAFVTELSGKISNTAKSAGDKLVTMDKYK